MKTVTHWIVNKRETSVEMIRNRIKDGVLGRLKTGVLDKGKWEKSEEGHRKEEQLLSQKEAPVSEYTHS